MTLQVRRPIPARASDSRTLRAILRLELLESRTLLSAVSATDAWVAEPLSVASLAGVTNTTPRGYTPSQISRAYGFDQIWFSRDNKGDGAGQTIAIVAAYDAPNIAADLRAFDATMGIADPPSFRKIDQNGGTQLPAPNALWSQEISLDVQRAHAMAPAANIVLVETYTATIPDLIAGVNTARNLPDVSVVSMSWGSTEFAGMSYYDQYFTTPQGHRGVTFVASAGDSGAQAVWPAISPGVIAVGGTSLSAAGGYGGESAWSGSGGGYSRYVAQPSYQAGIVSSPTRTSPDVSYLANPATGIAIYDSYAVGGRSGWFQIGGTSAGAPQWAALVAIVNEGRALDGKASLGDGHEALYQLPAGDFHDVTSGSNGYAAKAGYDPVTGRGTPIANALVRDLVGPSLFMGPVAPQPPSSSSSSSPTSASSSSGANSSSSGTSPHYQYQLVYKDHRWYVVQVVANSAIDSDLANVAMSQLATSVSIATPNSVERPPERPSESGMRAETLAKGSDLAVPMMGSGAGSPRRVAGLATAKSAAPGVDRTDVRHQESTSVPDDAAQPETNSDAIAMWPAGASGATSDLAAFTSLSCSSNIAAAVDSCLGECERPLEFAAELASLAEPLVENDVELGLVILALSIVAAGSSGQRGSNEPTARLADRTGRRAADPSRG